MNLENLKAYYYLKYKSIYLDFIFILLNNQKMQNMYNYHSSSSFYLL